MTVSDWIDAISALGTVAAVGVALYLARKSDVHREAIDARKERIHALYLLPVLEGFFNDLRYSAAYVFFAEANPKSMDDVKEQLDRAYKWAQDFEKHSALGPLSTESLNLLPEIVGFRIARAIGLLHSIRIEISRFNPDQWSDPVKAVASKTAAWAGTQSLASDLIGVAIHDLKEKSKPFEIFPTGQELHGDPVED